MRLLKRLKNLWKLSGFDVPDTFAFYTDDSGKVVLKGVKKEQKLAQIIKRKTPTQEFLDEK